MTVLMIALLHTVPIVVVTAIFRTNAAMNVVACVMCVIALATGALSYAWVDLFAIAVAYALASDWLRKNKRLNGTSQDHLP